MATAHHCRISSEIKRGQTSTFQTCTLFSASFLALTTSRLPSTPSSPPLLSVASTLSGLKWAITSPKQGQSMQRSHEEQSARSKGARLSPLEETTHIQPSQPRIIVVYHCILNCYPINSKTILWGNSKITPLKINFDDIFWRYYFTPEAPCRGFSTWHATELPCIINSRTIIRGKKLKRNRLPHA